ncbi:MAG TPA: lysylphosphatidylglycerol synthase transmembrane domain-containing protein [Gemmataceae bacterium]|nr:lysylphosphatidylglycerol synthase transmembrane domain-containing protein [Gemmataceae bacterium]
MNLRKGLRLLGSVALLGWLAWRTDWRQVAEAFATLRWALWAAALGVYALAQLVSAVRWGLLARPLGFHRPAWQYVGFYFIGMFFGLFLPTSVGGDVVRGWYLDGGSGRRRSALFSVFVDRASGLLVLMGVAAVALVLCPVEVPVWVSRGVWGMLAAGLAGLALLPLLARRVHRFEAVRRSVEAARLYLRRPSLLAGTTALSLAVQAGHVAVVWLIGLALGLSVPAGYYAVVVPVVSLLTLLPVSINGVGVREAGMVTLLGMAGVSPGGALSLAFLWFLAFTVASLGGLGFSLFGHFPRPDAAAAHSATQGPPARSAA